MKLKTILLLLVLFALNPDIIQAGQSYNEILSLSRQDLLLGRKIIEENLTFEIFPKQWLKYGFIEKYVLKGSDGKLYLFKSYPNRFQGFLANSIWSARLSSLCGINSSVPYNIWLPVNGNMVYGTIQQLFQKVADYDSEELPKDNKWLAYYLFKWFLHDKEPQFLLTSAGVLIAVDGDEISDSGEVDLGSFGYKAEAVKRLIRLSLKEGSFDTYYRKALSFISYLEALPDESIIELCGPYAYKERIKALLLRKKRIRKEFTDYCRQIAKEEGKSIASSSQTDDSSLYAQGVLAGLKEKIAAKNALLKSLPEKKEVQKSIAVIGARATSEQGLILELRILPIDELAQAAKQKIEEIRIMRESAASPCEALAYSLYINRYEQFAPFYSYGVIPPERLRLVIAPETLDPGFVAANLCLGYSRNLKAGANKKMGRSESYSLDDLNNNIENLAQKGNDDGWGYILKGNCYLDGLSEHRNKNIPLQEYRKVIALKGADRQARYLAHVLSGYLYELNDELFRFGPGCDLEKAEEEFKLAVEQDPASVAAHLNLLAIYIKRSDFSQAKKEIKQLAKLDPYWKDKDREAGGGLSGNDARDLTFLVLDEEGRYVMSLVYSIKPGQPKDKK